VPDHHDHVPAAPSATADGLLAPGDPFARSLERWAADAAVDEAARRRARERWLRIQAEEEASLLGTVVDLAERAAIVALDVGEHRVRGRLAGVGTDFVAVRSDHGQQVLVRTASVEVVRAEPGAAPVVGDRTALVETGLAGVLGAVAAERPDVLVRTTSGTVVRGELRTAGVDVVQLRVAGEPPTPVWVPIAAIEVLVLDP
jgi:hypothetical protein